ncbi:MAG: DUF4238 domain-containing protein [Candidatus Acidiferrum sp.]
MSEYRKHHYVPVFYQKHFANASGLLWVYDRHRKVYQELAPKVVCSQKDLYTLKPDKAPKDQRIESLALGIADAECASALKELVTGKMPPDLSTSETIAYFAGLQFSRLPSSGRYISDVYKKAVEEMMRLTAVSVDRMKSVLDQYSEETGDTVNVSPESMVEAVRGNHLEVVVSERPFLEHIFEHADFLSKWYLRMSWDILAAPAETGFILCDDPFVIVPPRGGKDIGIAVPGAVKYFPLARQFCLRLGDIGGTLRYRKVDRETVGIINQNIAANSERFIMSPVKKQLERVVTDSASADMDPLPRFTHKAVNHDDHGSLQMLTRNPRRYFYMGSASEAP